MKRLTFQRVQRPFYYHLTYLANTISRYYAGDSVFGDISHCNMIHNGSQGGRHVAITIVFAMLATFFLTTCSDNDAPEKEYVEKKVVVTLDGVTDSISPWLSLSAYTINRSVLRVVRDNDTLNCKDGYFKIPKGSCQTPCQMKLYSRSRYPEYIHVGVTYRKRRTTPLLSDNLNVKVEAFRGDILELDTSIVMHSFKIEDKIKEADYIFSINF